MKIFKIKWELILSILLLVASIKSWICYGYVDTSLKTLSVACMTTFALMYIVIGYKTIETFRHAVIKSWK